MSGEGKSTVVDRPSKPDEDPPRRSGRRSIPPGERYSGGEEIGRGGMGRVVEATDTLLDRRVAVKQALTTDAELLRRFARETKITARLEHPSIVPVYDAGTADGAPFYVMRRVSGRPLSELIRDAPSLNERLALVPHLLAAAQAIAHAHQRGIIHRDIKPSNILVGELGETVVIDWGLAKVIGEPDDDGEGTEPDAGGSLRTRVGVVFGTPGFMDPNQLRGETVGPQGDVYSLGASLYNLLAAEPPHYADDSTRMMKLAALGPPVPISTVVPGVPAELSTIVDRATAYDGTRRYADAGAFAEELKRFLAGQLVASHRYSRTEHFVRFVRKHRAAVAIGGAATVILAVVAAFAVSQVVGERDRADAQAGLAMQGRREAEAARAMADERADQLLLSRARALVDTNPTAALASLKQLSPTSKRVDEARAIISATRIRGVAWAMKASNEPAAYATMDPAAVYLAQMTTDGVLHVYDLEARRLSFEVEVGRGAQPRWILDGKRVLVVGRGATRTFDVTGKESPSNLPDLAHAEVDERGLTLVGLDTKERAVRIDLTTRTTTVLAEHATDIQTNEDGTYTAVTTSNEIVVLDAAQRPVLRRPNPGEIARVLISKTKVAMLHHLTIVEAPLAGGPWKEQILPGSPNVKPYWIEYQNDRLFAVFTDGRIGAATDGTFHEVGRMEITSGGMMPFARDYLAAGADGRRIYYVDGSRMRELYLPIALRYIRIVARRAHSRIVAIGDGAIVVVDLETLPTLLPIARYQGTLFMNDRVLLSSSAYTYDYVWYNLVDNTTKRVKSQGVAQLRSYDRTLGLLLLVEDSEFGHRGIVMKIGDPTPTAILAEPFDDVQQVGGGLIYKRGNKVFGGLTPETRRELLTTDGSAILVRLGGTRFATVTDHELVRGDLATGELERLAVPPGPAVSYALGQEGSVVIARAERLYRWQGNALVEIARLPENVGEVYPLTRGLIATTSDHATVFVANDGKVTRLASTRGAILASEDRVIVPGQFQYDVIELPSFARWSLPITRAADTADVQLDLSPDGMQLIEKADDGRLWHWHLPVAKDFTSSLNATNLSEDPNGLPLWPWQSPK